MPQSCIFSFEFCDPPLQQPQREGDGIEFKCEFSADSPDVTTGT